MFPKKFLMRQTTNKPEPLNVVASSSVTKRLDTVLIILGTLAIGFDFIPLLLGRLIPYHGPSPAWLVFPFLVLVSFSYRIRSYISADLLFWVFGLSLPLLLYFLTVQSSENMPQDFMPAAIMKMVMTSLIIFGFFYVHSEYQEVSSIYISVLIFVSFIAILIMMLGIFGLIDTTIIVDRSREHGSTRLVTFGDANITTL